MSLEISPRARLGLAAAMLALVAGGAGYGIAHLGGSETAHMQTADPGRKALYWYDPMVPSQHFDKPGKSPFMDMQLVAKYADEGGGDAPGVRIDPATSQTLGLRTVAARRGELASSLTATGTIDFNQRDVAIVQARAGGFVSRVYARAPGDIIGAGAPLADLLVPEWAGAQAEFLAVRRSGNAALIQAARQRLALLGMPSGTIASVERTGRPHNVVTISTPTGGVIKTLDVRAGMTMTAGQTLAEVNGLGTVWLNAAVPEAIAGPLRPGQTVQATLAAFPGETLSGRVSAILPQTQADSRTLTVRIELPNRGGRLRPGMFATVSFGGSAQPALLVPSEALIRTGKRTLVMLALDKGRSDRRAARPVRRAGHHPHQLSRAGAADRREPGHLSAGHHHAVGARRQDRARLSFFGDSFVYVLFEDGTDLYWARSRVLEYLNQVQGRLPPTPQPALGPTPPGSAGSIQYALVDRTAGTTCRSCARCRTGS
jgi:Cu(I)/Ag(I) efflux system membrane fusion protein